MHIVVTATAGCVGLSWRAADNAAEKLAFALIIRPMH